MRLRVRGARHGGEADPDRPASRPRSTSDGGHPRGSPRDGEAGLTPGLPGCTCRWRASTPSARRRRPRWERSTALPRIEIRQKLRQSVLLVEVETDCSASVPSQARCDLQRGQHRCCAEHTVTRKSEQVIVAPEWRGGRLSADPQLRPRRPCFIARSGSGDEIYAGSTTDEARSATTRKRSRSRGRGGGDRRALTGSRQLTRR